MRLAEIDELDGSMLQALAEAAREKQELEAWSVPEAQRASTQELLHAIYRTMHKAWMQAPHPPDDWEAWRPAHIVAQRQIEAQKPLSPRAFFGKLLGRR